MTEGGAVRLAVRLLLVALPVAACGVWFYRVEAGGPWFLRNLLPPMIVVLLSAWTLWRGDGRFTGAGWQRPLGIAGFAIPALGLALYLHYACIVNLDGMFDDGPGELFRYLPVYTVGAGSIGFLIGWIVGRNVKHASGDGEGL